MSKIVRTIKNVTGSYSKGQIKVRKATSNDEMNPSNSLMQEIAEMTFQNSELFLIMDIVDKRLNDRGKNWRHVFKALILLDYLVRNGSDNVIIWCRENIYIIKSLREFQHIDELDKDNGKAIRARASELTVLLLDNEALRQARSGLRQRRGNSRNRRHRESSEDSRHPSRYRQGAGSSRNREDDDVQRAIELSKQSALEDEKRRRELQSASSEDIAKAMSLSQQQQQPNTNLIDLQDSSYYPQPQLMMQTGLLQYANTGQLYSEADMEQYRLAQQQFQQQQAELQRQWELQQQQQAAIEAQQLATQQQLAQLQYEAYQRQLAEQQTPQPQMQPLEPLKTGSENPFALFNQQQQQQQSSSASPASSSAPSPKPALQRQNTFDKEHMANLNNILSNEAPADSFGNTGSQRFPAQHTARSFINSAGHGLEQHLTGVQPSLTGLGGASAGSNNPFAKQYTGIATTQVQPTHTGYGFGNANSTPQSSSGNLIDF